MAAMIARRTTNSRGRYVTSWDRCCSPTTLHVALTEYNRNVIRWSRL
jgi:hypothetical protein